MHPASLRLVTLVVAFGGLFAAMVLSLGHVLDLPVPCGGSHGCATVAQHPASKVFGVPIAFGGVAAYLIIIFLLSCLNHRSAKIVLLAITAIGSVVSVALLIYSYNVIQATCQWCIASGTMMILLLALAVVLTRIRQPIQKLSFAWFFGLGLITSAAVGIAAGQMQRSANMPPISAQRLANLTVDDLVDPAKSVGPDTAPLTIVMFADLWCPACRAIHQSLVDFQQANPKGVRLAFRHRPLSGIPGHEQSGAAAALSEIAAEHDQFWPFIEAVFTAPQRLTREGYLNLMQRLEVKPAEIENRIADLNDPAVLRVWQDIELAERLGIDATPTFIVMFEGHELISANLRILPRILNSPIVLAKLGDSISSNNGDSHPDDASELIGE
ncbi:hypothetical protein GCM10023156_23220 [Novipirellula rosea]|uniref:Vitamin K epoxide reductase domain-containing protein n=2 Tax=Novipirellula rosea TaxID=1031540 RepID=A0ABP8MMR4_9BACT